MSEPMFRGELAFLSNFDTTPFWSLWLGEKVRSAEHAFNAVKTLDADERRQILDAPTPGEAKKLGRVATLREGWDTGFRVAAMQTILHEKFVVNELNRKLLATGDLYLVETNHWHDNFWGDCYCNFCTDSGCFGKNMLGELLMSVRAVNG